MSHKHNRLEDVLNLLPEGLIFVDREGVIKDMNQAALELFGLTRKKVIGRRYGETRSASGEGETLIAQVLGTGKAVKNALQVKKKPDGSALWFQASAAPLRNAAGDIEEVVIVLTDITGIKAAHSMLNSIASFSRDLTCALSEREAFDIFRHYLVTLSEGGAQIDAIFLININADEHGVQEVIKYQRSALYEIVEFPGIDKCKAFVYSGTFIVDDLSQDYACPFHHFPAKRGSCYCTAINIGGAVSGVLYLYSSAPSFFSGDMKETIDSFIALLVPVINTMRLLELNKKLALIDPLTGLYNRRYLEAFMDKQLAIADRNNQLLSIIMMDIDDFKRFNDTYGHEAGDNALRTISHAIGQNIRASDIGVRYGGEEFIIVLPNTDKMTALEVAERMRTTIESTPVSTGPDKRIFITASFGVATYGIDATNLDAIIAQADVALYEAKKAGKNRTSVA